MHKQKEAVSSETMVLLRVYKTAPDTKLKEVVVIFKAIRSHRPVFVERDGPGGNA